MKALSVNKVLAEFKISRSTFYRTKLPRPDRDEDDFKIIKKYFDRSKSKDGIRQLKMVIERKEGLILNRKKIARIKNKYGLETKIRRKNIYRKFAKLQSEHQIAPNLLNRNFKINEPDLVYSIDITQVKYGAKKAYIAAVKDLCTKEIVSKKVSNRMDIELTNNTLSKAIKNLSTEGRKKLMIHSDQGFHFTHISYRDILANNGITQSMSRKGNCLDNAPIESFFGCLKDHLELKNCKEIQDVKNEVTKQVNYYNYERPQLGLKKMPPTLYRRHLKS